MNTDSERKSAPRPKPAAWERLILSSTRPASPLSDVEIAAGLQRMAAFLDPDLAARKVAADFALSHPLSKRTDDNA